MLIEKSKRFKKIIFIFKDIILFIFCNVLIILNFFEPDSLNVFEIIFFSFLFYKIIFF